jgi:Nucleotidyltransferase of unknown function (DUF6036)
MPRSVTPTPEPWSSFLGSLDAALSEGVQLHCIGGFVVTQLYGISRETSDLDVLTTLPDPGRLAELQRLAGEGSDLHRRFRVYLQPVPFPMHPEDYESRLVPMCADLGLGKLSLLGLEAHDLALTKLDRNSDVDRQDVLALAAAGWIEEKTLRERYAREYRPNLPSGQKKLDLTVELWVEMCWPKKPPG